jgi:diguanylate cyclase (GGDEF)-like protein/PAS domain S-box-containing protein
VRTRAPVIHNDYASLPDKKGMPEGHAQVVREMVVPILRSDKVVAVLGVGNKGVEYTGEDLETAQQLASMVMEMAARKRAEEALYQANARLMQAQRITRLGDWEFDLRTGRLNWSEQVYRILGLDPASETPDLAGHRQLLHPEDYPQFEAEVNAALQFGTPYQNEMRAVRPDGEIRYIWYTGQAGKNAEGKVERLFGTVQDITDRKQSEAKLEQATHFDALTGLPNMRWLFKRMQQLIEAGADTRLALLLLNIDRFAQLNESLGRGVGDLVLMTLAQRWSVALPDGCVLVRLAGDQFVILRTDFEDTESIIETAAGLIDATRQPIQLRAGDKPVLLTVSIGIALYPNDAADANALLHAAEDAMRSAKADKGNQARFFDRKQAQASIDWFETEAALREALGRDEFFLLYQPQIDTATGRVSAVEALIRWRRDGKVVPPGNFIHVVEGTDLAEPVSRWVLQTACRQARQWMERQRPLRVAVNIFSAHVTSGRLLDDVSLALSSNRLPAHLLELEVVESSLLVNPELAAQTLRDLKRMGVGLALDDFGTGYSSLGYLKHYPFDELKIDQMFTRNVNRVPEDAAIVRSTIALAHNLGMRVLAEGVETESQLRFLARYGCDQLQGYLFSRPTEPAVVETAVMERSDLRPLNPQLQIRTHGVLVLEDEPVEQILMRDLLEDAGYRVYIAANQDSAITLMGTEAIDVIVSDYYLEKETGVDILERISRFYPEVPSIVVSGSSEQSVVVEAINRAAIRGFLAKPVQPELLLRLLRSIFDAAAAHERV